MVLNMYYAFILNPAAGKPKGVALEMFETKCGGKVESILCSWDSRYDKLSTMVLADDAPDMEKAYSAAKEFADGLLSEALGMWDGKPQDDMSVLVVKVY